jgi:hypothetical protein
MPYAGRNFSDADESEDEYFCLNFVNDLPPGVVVTDVYAPCELTVVETIPGFAVDDDPSSRLIGPAFPTIPTDGTSSLVVGVGQRIAGLKAGNQYLLQAFALASNGASYHLSSMVRSQPVIPQ